MERYTYVGMGEVPFKLMTNQTILKKRLISGKWNPIHAVILPTNKCNLECAFCNCANRDKEEELSLADLHEIMSILKSLEVDTITLSGGGEPTVYTCFDELIELCRSNRMNVGLVTNGVNLSSLLRFGRDTFKWIRISCGDGRNIDQFEKIIDVAEQVLEQGISSKIGVSYIISDSYNNSDLKRLISKIEKSKIEYIKILQDCFCEKQNDISIQNYSKVIVARPFYDVIDNEVCKIPLLKPIIAADGYIYPCCDIQYHGDGRKYKKEYRICHYSEYLEFVESQQGYMAKHCNKCYHSLVNEYINMFDFGIDDCNWI